jgi:3-hydroxy-9,10-secoandrosta-1,3,5(10)-triene-9,17-dione monooxygenase reductase component
MPIDSMEFRRIMSHWVTGVAIVAARHADGSPRGLTANAVSSLSLHPPLLLVCIEHDSETHDCIHDAGAFSVNILDASQAPLARRFSDERADVRFEGVLHETGPTGAPILRDTLAWAECRLHDEHVGGDHTIFVGRVVAGGARDGEPLIFFGRGFGLGVGGVR